MTALAFVPAHRASGDLPGKLLRPFCGRPLLYWSLRALQGARRVDRVVVATDSIEIADVALSFGFSKVEIHRRTAVSAGDGVGIEHAMLDYLTRSRVADTDVLVLAQATSPFTRAQDIDGALAAFATGAAHSMVACVPMRRLFWNHEGRPLNYDPQQRPTRQELDGCLMENGAFYV